MKTVKTSFKKSIAFLLWIIVASGPSYGFEKTFTFNLSDFSFVNKNGVVQIMPNDLWNYSFDFNQGGYPNIPFFEYEFESDKECVLSTLRYRIVEKRIIATNVEIQENRPSIPTGEVIAPPVQAGKMSFASYPNSLIRLYNGPVWNDNRIVLSIAPFIYDQPNRSLYFVSQIQVSYEEQSSKNVSSRAKSVEHPYGLRDVDYLIITRDSLVETFKTLRDWKTAKGVKTKIVTVDSICSLFSIFEYNYTPSQKIKSFIMGSSAKMVLLGGDRNIVPSQITKLEYRYQTFDVDTLYSGFVYSDMFYSCTLAGDWTWDQDPSNPVGEIGVDGVVLTPNVAVSRLPIRTKNELSSYIQKLFHYERNPERNNYASRLLLTGRQCHWFDSYYGMSDAQIESETMYELAFLSDTSKYHNISRNYFYDTGNSFGRVGDYSLLNDSNLSNVINNYRPHLFNMYCHGDSTSWKIDEHTPFTKASAMGLENNGVPMIIATNACHTADFSQSTPCLAEAFLTHPLGGAIAYWGSSHLGFSSREAGYSVDASTAMCMDFWKILPDSCNFGMAVLSAKKRHSLISDTNTNTNNWLLKSMNALGDCEVPVYTEEPKDISNIRIEINYGNVEAISEDYKDYRMAIVSKKDNGESIFRVADESGIEIIPFNHKTCSICLTKHNYVPFYVETGRFACSNGNVLLFLQNQKYNGNMIHYGDNNEIQNIYIGNHVDAENENGDVVVEADAEVTFRATNRVTLASGFKCNIGGKLEINKLFQL